MLKTIFLGIEGLQLDLIEKWIDKLPNIKRVHEQGAWGTLNPTLPLEDMLPWQSICLGEHIWFKHSGDYNQTLEKNDSNNDSLTRGLHTWLPKNGQRIALLNYPVLRNGEEIPGGFSLTVKKDSDNPEGIRTSGIDVGIPPLLQNVNANSQIKDKVLSSPFLIDRKLIELTKYFVLKKQCDFVFILLQEYPVSTENENYSAVLDYYTWIDEAVESIRSIQDENTTFIIASPYGLKTVHSIFRINEWLIQEGYLNLKTYPTEPEVLNLEAIDQKRSMCWVLDNRGSLYLNRNAGPAESKKIVQELIDKLKSIEDEQGNPINLTTLKPEDIFSLRRPENSPAVFVRTDKANIVLDTTIGSSSKPKSSYVVTGDSIRMNKTGEGYLGIIGEEFPIKGRMESVSILHLAPTIIDGMRLDIPWTMEKESLLRIFVAESRDDETESIQARTVSSKEKDDVVRSRLEALGY